MSLADRLHHIAGYLTGSKTYTHERTMPQGMDDGELYAMMDGAGLTTSGGYVLTDDQARDKMHEIMAWHGSNSAKYDALHVLDVEIQNKGESGIASPVILEILAQQYELIEAMRKE